MGSLQRLFLRITPIITLICFICLGITHIFAQNENDHVTYLTSETITIDDNNTPNDTTDDITLENYTFDFAAYRQNINGNKLKEATEKVLDLETFNTNRSTFNLIWADGYQIGDVIKTIGNAVIFIININIVAINAILMPIRLVAGILITALSIVGININRTEGIIIPFLNNIIIYLAIPLISPSYQNNSEIYDTLSNTTWLFTNTPSIPLGTKVNIQNIEFTSNGQTYNSIGIYNYNQQTYENGVSYLANYNGIKYGNTLVYQEGWTNQAYRTIEITATNNKTSNDLLSAWLERLAEEQITGTSPYYNVTYEWNNVVLNAIQQYPEDYGTHEIDCNFTFTSNNEQFTGFNFSYFESTGSFFEDRIIYKTENGGIIVWKNGTWTNSNYQQFLVTQQQWDVTNDDVFTELIQRTWLEALN